MGSYQRYDKTVAREQRTRRPVGAAIIRRRLLGEDDAIRRQIGQITVLYGIKR